MTEKKKKSTSDRARVYAILDFLQLGFKDYIGARTLLRQSLPIQGATLASTAVEKYLKAILALRGNQAHGHLKKAHWNALENYLPELWSKLNPKFLVFLQRAYELRYSDNLQSGYNIVVYCRETLAELDHTVVSFQDSLNFTHSAEIPIRTPFDVAVERKDPLLFEDNWVLLGQERNEFLSKPDSACAIRHRGFEGLLEAEFTVFSSHTDGNFEREGLRPVTEEELRRKAAETPAV